MLHVIIVVFDWYVACLIYCILYTVVCNILIHIFNQERGCVIFRSHGSKFTDIIQPICKTSRQITALDWFQQVRICILVISQLKELIQVLDPTNKNSQAVSLGKQAPWARESIRRIMDMMKGERSRKEFNVP